MKDFQTAVADGIGKVGGFFDRVRRRFDTREDAASDGEKIARGLRKFFALFAPVAFAGLLGAKRLPLGIYPLGLSLAAAGYADTPALSIGVLIAALYGRNIPLLFGCVTLLLLRVVFSLIFADGEGAPVKQKLFSKESRAKLFCESDTLRLCSASVAAFTAGMARMFSGGFSFGDLFAVCFSVLVCPCLTYLYLGFTAGGERKSFRFEAGLCALLVSFVYALSEISPLGFSTAAAAAAMLAFLTARRRDPLAAGVLSLLISFAAAPAISPATALAAVVSSLLFARSSLLALACGVGVFSGASLLAGGTSLLLSALPEVLVGAGISLTVRDAAAEKLLPVGNVRRESGVAGEILSYKEKSGRETVKELSESFESLSKAFFELSDRESRVGIFDVRRICDRVCDRFCRRCAACTLCWERDYAVTLDTLNKISAKLYKTGKIEKKDLPPEFLARCTSADRIVEEIERENAKLLKEMLAMDGSRRAAVDYAVFARVLSEALEKNDAEYRLDEAGRAAAVAALRHIGFSADSIGVFGVRKKSVYAFRIGGGAMKCTADKITEALSDALGGVFEPPVFEFADGGINMITKNAPIFSADCSLASLASSAGEENGDRVRSFDSKNGCFYALVSDGMGSGSAAARKSGKAALFLEKMLRAGNGVSAALELLSALARSDGEEGFTTVDLFELDTFTGRGTFFKSGAAPSFVKRGERIFKIRSRTVPIGILEDVDAEKTSFDCEDGDAVVILSDGVTEEIEEPLWLCEFLTGADLSASDAAARILTEAKRHTLCRDDMTAAVLHIRKSGKAAVSEEKEEKKA